MKPTIDERLGVLHRRLSVDLEQYNALRHAVERWCDGDRHHIIAVTSPAVGDGKTTTAVNLAGVLAHRAGARILLVDADLRRPSVGSALGLNGASGAGLADVILQPDSALEAMVTRIPAINLDVLPAGRPTDQPYELLRTPRMAALLEDARRQYDFVVIDTSPFLLVSDARSLERLVDGFLVVVGAHRTPRKQVDDVLRLISRRKLIGLVFNGGDRPLSGYYGSYDDYASAPSRDDALAGRARR